MKDRASRTQGKLRCYVCNTIMASPIMLNLINKLVHLVINITIVHVIFPTITYLSANLTLYNFLDKSQLKEV